MDDPIHSVAGDRDLFWLRVRDYADRCLSRLRRERRLFSEIDATDVLLHHVRGENYTEWLRRRCLSGEIRGEGGVRSCIRTLSAQLVFPWIRVETGRIAKRGAIVRATTSPTSGGASADDAVMAVLRDDDDATVAVAVAEVVQLVGEGRPLEKSVREVAEAHGVERRALSLSVREAARRIAEQRGRTDLVPKRGGRRLIGGRLLSDVEKEKARAERAVRPRRRKSTSQEGQGGPIDTSRRVEVG